MLDFFNFLPKTYFCFLKNFISLLYRSVSRGSVTSQVLKLNYSVLSRKCDFTISSSSVGLSQVGNGYVSCSRWICVVPGRSILSQKKTQIKFSEFLNE